MKWNFFFEKVARDFFKFINIDEQNGIFSKNKR